MSLSTLENKEPKEILKLLSAVSTSILPNPSVGKSVEQTKDETETINTIVSEIRHRLNIPDNDYSSSAQSKIFDYLSKEISNITLSDENISKVRKRIGSRGELPLSEYKIVFDPNFAASEILGEKKSNAISAIKEPDRFIHINSKNLELDNYNTKYGLTLLIKIVTPKRIDDKFIQIVLCARRAETLLITAIFRAYFSEINLNQLINPLDILEAFVDKYGLIFSLGGAQGKFIHNDVMDLRRDVTPSDIKILSGQKGNFYSVVMLANESRIAGKNDTHSLLNEIILCFAFDISRYAETLKRHNVYFNVGEISKFRQIK